MQAPRGEDGIEVGNGCWNVAKCSETSAVQSTRSSFVR